jgi:hypothetical protein
MADIEDLQVANLLRERLLKSHRQWADRVLIDDSGAVPALNLASPHCEGHTLSIQIDRTEATVAYSDGCRPGPAERLLIWNEAPVAAGIDAVCEYIDQLVQGRIVLVRERLLRFVQFIFRHHCGSRLWFVPTDELRHWSPGRQRRILRAWSWDGAPVSLR